ncbi:MAG: hypothetical protein RJA07_2398 [Bacteroidota bacterium]|jgi:gliding motility-associated-like protein
MKFPFLSSKKKSNSIINFGFALFIFLLQINYSKAQCPPNIGFESNNLASWQTFISDPTNCGTIGCCPINACWLKGINFQIPGRVQVVNNTFTNSGTCPAGIDCYSNLPIVCPNLGFGNISFKLGNDTTGSQSERVRVAINVTAANSVLVFRYAAVLNNGGHLPADQPRFSAVAKDQNGNPLGCANFTIPTPPLDSLNLYPGWFAAPNDPLNTVCSNWNPIAINLSALVGQVITLEFATGDCSFGGHFGYCYVDIVCGNKLEALNGYCPGSSFADIYGPPGFANYVFDTVGTGAPPIYAGPSDSIRILSPDTSVIYSLTLLPYGAASGCDVTIFDTLHVLPKPNAYFHFKPSGCVGEDISFIDSSQTHVKGSFIIQWQWNFGDSHSSAANNVSSLQHPTHAYSKPGTYLISLIVHSDLSCVSDTITHTITINPAPPLNPNAGQDATVCKYTTTTLNGSANPAYGPYTYSWTPSAGLSNPSITNPSVTAQTQTDYIFTVQTTNLCKLSDTVTVFIGGVTPFISIIGKDTVCPGASQQLDIKLHPPFCGTTTSNCNASLALVDITSPMQGSSSSYNSPFYGWSSDMRMQLLYTKQYLNSVGIYGGLINSIALNILNKTSTTPFINYTIKMGCTNLSSLTASYVTNGMYIVYQNTSYTTSTGWNTFLLNDRFMYDGVSNLVVEICFDMPGNGSAGGVDNVQNSIMPYTAMLYETGFGASAHGCTLNGGFPSALFELPDLRVGVCTDALLNPQYSWSPSTFLSSTTIPNPTITSPNTDVTYTLNITDGACTGNENFSIVIDHSNYVVAAPDTTVCGGNLVNLIATGYGPKPLTSINCGANNTPCNGGKTNTVGLASYSTTYPSPFDGFPTDARMQFLYNQADMNAAGILGGATLTSIAFNVITKNSTIPFSNFTIKMGCTNLQSISGFVNSSNLSTVYTNNAYSSIAGINRFQLNTNFDWDGVSSLLVEVCFDNTITDQADDVMVTSTTNSMSVVDEEYANAFSGCVLTNSPNSTFSRPDATFDYCDAPAPNYHFTWTPNTGVFNPNKDTTMAQAINTTTYTISMTGLNGCIVSDQMIVNISKPFQIQLADSVQPCLHTSFQLHFISDIAVKNITWSSKNNVGIFSCTTCTDPVFTADSSCWVYLNTANDVGCGKFDSIWISYSECPEVIVPSAFHPNSADTKNNYFFLLNRKFAKLSVFEIYNRWGQLIYTTTDLNALGWDGTYNGQPQETGVFLYNITVIDSKGKIKTKKGNVTLLR